MKYSRTWKRGKSEFRWAYIRHKGKLYRRLMMKVLQRHAKRTAKIMLWVFVGAVFVAVATMGVLHFTWMPIYGQLWLLELFVRARIGAL